MAKRLYYDNSYLREFEAQIVEQYKKNDKFAVILDQTAFYPASGGQMADSGFLNDQPVLDVIEDGEEIIHLVSEPLKAESSVSGKLDWNRRFDFMQQHTGFHILAQSFLQISGVITLSSHLGELKDTIDVDMTELTWEQVYKIERHANTIVWQNRPVASSWISAKEVDNLSLRKPPKFFNKPIRLIDIKDFDLDPCGGTHVQNTGEVGLIKVLSWEKVRNNIRCSFVAGKRALIDYQNRTKITQKISQILSTSDSEMIGQVELLKQNVKIRDKQLKKLQLQLLDLEAAQLVSQGKKHKGELWIEEIKLKDPVDIRYLAVNVSKKIPAIVVFYTTADPAYLVISCENSRQIDLGLLIPKLRDILGAKGGGRATFAELNYLDKSQFNQAFEFLKKSVAKQLAQK